jgi:hypothetical protein
MRRLVVCIIIFILDGYPLFQTYVFIGGSLLAMVIQVSSFKIFEDTNTWRIEFLNEFTLYTLSTLHSVFMIEKFSGRAKIKSIEFKSNLGMVIIATLCTNFVLNILMVVYSVYFEIYDGCVFCFTSRMANKKA